MENEKFIIPHHSDKVYIIPPRPNNFIDVLWLGLDKKYIGIHGTSQPELIGKILVQVVLDFQIGTLLN